MRGKGLAFVTFDRPIQAKPLTFLLYNNCLDVPITIIIKNTNNNNKEKNN